MRDTISINRAYLLHPKIRQEIITLIDKAEARLPGVAIRIVQGLRSFEEQDKLYAQGRSTPGPRVTNSKGGQSYHNYGLAIDFSLLYDKEGNGSYETLSWDTLKDFDKDGESDWMEVVEIFEQSGFVWGGRFTSLKDNPHLEKTFSYNWRALLAKYQSKDFIPVTNYVNV